MSPDPEQDQSFGRMAQAIFAAEQFKQRAEVAEARVKELEATVTDLKEIIEAEFPGFFDGLEAAASILRGEEER